MNIKRKIKEKRIQLVGGLIGICVAVVSLFYFFHVEKAEAEERLVEIVNYVKVQCSTYTHYNESSESKSLLRAIESARQMSTNIDMEIENGGQLSREFLKENLQTLWVDGIVVLDTEGKLDCEFKIDMEADKRKEQNDVSEKSITGFHILLAEDNELNMEIAEFMLQNVGAEVTKAWNGQEAVELFKKSKTGEFDVILMDIMMPVMNGYDAAKQIRAMDREDARVIPIIAMTANAFTEDRIRAKEAGMDEHISKPVDVKLLLKVIHKLVEKSKKEYL